MSHAPSTSSVGSGTTAHTPRVTIGVPVYNSERFLAQTLESLLAQTYRDIEIVVCDNASTDDTQHIVSRFAERDARIRSVRNPTNIGAGRNFVRCVELARGELFRWSSADDLSAPTFVERCVEALDAHPDVIQAYPRTILIDESGRELERYDDPVQTMAERARERYRHVAKHLGLVNAFYGLMRTAELRRTAIHGSYAGADLVVQSEIALYGKILELPEYLFFRRMHAAAHSGMSPAEWSQFYNPQGGAQQDMWRWRHLRERLASVRRSPLSRSERVLISMDILWMQVQTREQLARQLWKGVMSRLRSSDRLEVGGAPPG